MTGFPHPSLRIDADRLMARLDELAQVGAIPATAGCARLALTDEDRRGRDLVVGWMRDLDLEMSIDGIGNMVGVRAGAGDGPPVLCGSHIDTVRTGGRYDGNLGVLAGLEIIETLAGADITTHHPVGVAVFTNEEGSRFPPDMMGSLVHTGAMALEEALDVVGIDGVRVGDALDEIGYRGGAPCPAPVPRAFAELHIEQGPVLEAEQKTIGVVTGVQGISWTEVTIDGQSNHAGTTPMHLRHDAGFAAAAATTYVRTMVDDLGPPMVGTVGAIDLHPDLVNVVAARAVLTVDLRHTDDEVLGVAEARLAAELRRIAEAEGVVVTTRSLARFAPVDFDPATVGLVEQVATQLGHSTMRLPSGAGHDAQVLAAVCPTAMVFVPSQHGLSHNPAEHTDAADIEAGANVLLHTLLALADGEGT